MGRVLHIIRNALIQTLGGFTREEIQPLVLRANVLGALSKKGKYDLRTALVVAANARIVTRITKELGFPRCGLEGRECRVSKVEVVHRGGAIPLPASTYQAPDEARTSCLLAKIAGPTVGAQLDIQRECVESNDAEQELQREKQVLHLVPSDCTQRMLPSAQA